MAKRRGRQRSAVSEHEVYERIATEDDFAELRRRYRGFAFPATVAFMVWYIAYVVCNNWARGFMDTRVVGNINVAVVFGLLQFASTFLIAWIYWRFANNRLDPVAGRIRAELEQEALAETGNVILNGCLATMANMLKRSLTISLPEVLRGDGARMFAVSQDRSADGLVLFLYINFSVRNRDIRGYIAMLMDLPSLTALKELIAGFIERVVGGDVEAMASESNSSTSWQV